jgi:PTH1 family peptidyl-tRNA hydrolase
MIAGRKVMLVKPQTYMNESGQSIRDVVNYYGITPEKLAVIYDDIDLPAGTLRIRKKGSAGTHNGMKNIIYLLEEDGFPRFRIGIGSERGRIPLRDYVLAGFSGEDREKVRDAVIRCADAIETTLGDGIEAAMLKYNISSKKSKKTDEEQNKDDGGIRNDGA